MGQLVSRLIFNHFHLLVRPGGDHLLAPIWLSLAAARSAGQGWPKAIAKRLALTVTSTTAGNVGRVSFPAVSANDDNSEAELAFRRGDRAHPCIRSIHGDRNHDAVMRIAAKLRSSGPILHRGSEAMEERRVTATSDRRQPHYRQCGCHVVLLFLVRLPSLTPPDAR